MNNRQALSDSLPKYESYHHMLFQDNFAQKAQSWGEQNPIALPVLFQYR
jgi:hypothetical protein